MLYEFLKTHRDELISRCRAKFEKRTSPHLPVESEFGIPQFLTQLTETFRVEQSPQALAAHRAGGSRKPSLALVPSEIPSTAAKHGDELRRHGFTVDQVVHGYGDLCQALTELALEEDAPITVDEFHTFNRCLDDAIADAVTAFTRYSGSATTKRPTRTMSQDNVDHMRNAIETAVLTFAAIKGGSVSLNGSTATLHEKTLLGLRESMERGLADGAPGSVSL